MPLKRSEVNEKLKWKMTDIFSSQEEFDKLFEEVSGKIGFGKYEGKLSDEKVLLNCLRELDEVETSLEKLDVYAYMLKDLDTRDSSAAALLAKVENLLVSYSSAVSFITPELTSLPEEKLQAIIADPAFSDYDYIKPARAK